MGIARPVGADDDGRLRALKRRDTGLAGLPQDLAAACCLWLPERDLREVERVGRGLQRLVARRGLWRARFLQCVEENGWCLPPAPPRSWKLFCVQYARERGVDLHEKVCHGSCTVAWRVAVPMDGRELRLWSDERPFSVDALGDAIMWQYEAFFPAGFAASSKYKAPDDPVQFVYERPAQGALGADVRTAAPPPEMTDTASYATAAGSSASSTTTAAANSPLHIVAPLSPDAGPAASDALPSAAPPQATLRVWTTNPWTANATKHYYGAYCTVSLRDPFNTAAVVEERHVDIDNGEAFAFTADMLAVDYLHGAPSRGACVRKECVRKAQEPRPAVSEWAQLDAEEYGTSSQPLPPPLDPLALDAPDFVSPRRNRGGGYRSGDKEAVPTPNPLGYIDVAPEVGEVTAMAQARSCDCEACRAPTARAERLLHPEAVFHVTLTLALEWPMSLDPYYSLLSVSSVDSDVVKIGYCRAMFEIARYKRKHGGTFVKPGDRNLAHIVKLLTHRRTSEALRFEVYHALFNILGTGAVLLPDDIVVDLLWSCVVHLAAIPVQGPPGEPTTYTVHLAENLLGNVFNLLLHSAAREVLSSPQAVNSLTRLLHNSHFSICRFSTLTVLLSLKAWGVAFSTETADAVDRHAREFMATADPTDPHVTGVAWDESDVASFFIPLLRSPDLLCIEFVAWCMERYYH
eukprot:TRINITY_DN4644_c0_g2_i1.p1 TRINITY_DN4644_c0_g2~~TRINITY_DN4644_c0_g2_i1.p1  ORF type:complete len:690 (+),score=192.16 TRINITY_DN4644_c0_g2_i1:40-2109(+)